MPVPRAPFNVDLSRDKPVTNSARGRQRCVTCAWTLKVSGKSHSNIDPATGTRPVGLPGAHRATHHPKTCAEDCGDHPAASATGHAQTNRAFAWSVGQYAKSHTIGHVARQLGCRGGEELWTSQSPEEEGSPRWHLKVTRPVTVKTSQSFDETLHLFLV